MDFPRILFFLLLLLVAMPEIKAWEELVAATISAVDNGKRDALALIHEGGRRRALVDCVKLYEDCEYRLRLLSPEDGPDDVRVAVSAALTSHRTCVDGMVEVKLAVPDFLDRNVTRMLESALVAAAALPDGEQNDAYCEHKGQNVNTSSAGMGYLSSWNPSSENADIVVAKDGSGNYQTLNEALGWLRRRTGDHRVVIYVKAGVYVENVEIEKEMRNVALVGDGMDKTVISEHRSMAGGYSILRSATFGVSADGFWARDITFENTAGPANGQAVALRVSSDRSVFYRCRIRGYQDTLFLYSCRQFYRECDIQGTIDFVFGNAIAVLQGCTITIRKPLNYQYNVITAQGRENKDDKTGISMHNCKVVPSADFQPVKGIIKTFLGRPWKEYSRVVFLKSDLDGMVDPKGWSEWSGGFALNTLYYGEYLNRGQGADTRQRVNWPGFHVLRTAAEAEPFTVGRFLQGMKWLQETGVPFSAGL